MSSAGAPVGILEVLEISRAEFDSLPLNYPPPNAPSYLGQRWKSEREGVWLIAEYVPLDEGAILWRKARIID